MNNAAIHTWSEKLITAWQTKNPNDAANLFSKKAIYHEDPFQEPLTDRVGIMHIWNEIKEQQNLTVKHLQTWETSKNIGFTTWECSYQEENETVYLSGIWLIRLNEHGLCKEFHQWWQQASR